VPFRPTLHYGNPRCYGNARSFMHSQSGPSGLSGAIASAKGSHVAGQETPPEAEASSACPDCGTEMVIISITPILFVREFEELTLACQKCGFSKILKIKRKSH
jgi:predicted RNA-binding Zn-ribbon protein involved in translation (DUF1610 family)